MADVVEHPNRNNGLERMKERQRAAIKRELKDRRRERVDAKLGEMKPSSGKKRAPVTTETKRLMAQNLGDLAFKRASGDESQALKVLATAFSNVFSNTAGRGDSQWSKRLRYVRLPSDVEKTKGRAEPFASKVENYVSLAKAIAKAARLPSVSEEDDDTDALYCLLKGTDYDPDPARGYRADIDSERALTVEISALRQAILAKAPRLEWYFKTLMEQRLSAPSRDGETYKFSMSRGRFDGDSGEGELDPVSIIDGWAREDGDDYPSFGPQMHLGVLTMHVCPDSFALSDKQKASFTNSDGTWLADARTSIELILAEMDAAPVANRHSYRDVFGIYEETWTVDLMLLPTGRADRFTIEPMLYFTCASESLSGYGYDKTELVGEPLVTAGMRVERRRSKARSEPHEPSSDLIRVFDLRRWKRWEHQEIDALEDEILFSADSTGGRRWLLQLLSVRERADLPSPIAEPVYTFDPSFVVPAAYAPVPAASIGGLIVRNLAFAEPDETVACKLIADAQCRIEALQKAVEEWEADYVTTRDARIGRLDQTKKS